MSQQIDLFLHGCFPGAIMKQHIHILCVCVVVFVFVSRTSITAALCLQG